jgi:hypothetical protein
MIVCTIIRYTDCKHITCDPQKRTLALIDIEWFDIIWHYAPGLRHKRFTFTEGICNVRGGEK